MPIAAGAIAEIRRLCPRVGEFLRECPTLAGRNDPKKAIVPIELLYMASSETEREYTTLGREYTHSPESASSPTDESPPSSTDH